ncbi:MAG TPA: acyl carrier protein [Candidatus Enterenecus avicola]|nr:acyl carrier protein [Candidatus Enterenecus avicola]
MFEKLCALIAEQFGVDADTITADTTFVDELGADSVDLVDLSMALEDEFGMEEMEEEEISSIVTVGDLYKYMQEHLDL